MSPSLFETKSSQIVILSMKITSNVKIFLQSLHLYGRIGMAIFPGNLKLERWKAKGCKFSNLRWFWRTINFHKYIDSILNLAEHTYIVSISKCVDILLMDAIFPHHWQIVNGHWMKCSITSRNMYRITEYNMEIDVF